MIPTKEAIGIAEVVIVMPLCFVTTYLSFRHSFYKQLAWFFLFLLCGLMVASGSLAIEIAHDAEDRTKAVWAAILGSIGLNPLLLASMGLLKTVNEQISPRPKLRILLLQLLHLPCSLAIILCIIGGIHQSSSDPKEQSNGKTSAKIGVVIFVFAFGEILLLALLTLRPAQKVPVAHRRLLYAVLLALPLITIRLLYTILADFSTSTTFSVSHGNPSVQFCMAIVEEIIVVILYSAAGLAALGTAYQPLAQNLELDYGGNVHTPLNLPKPEDTSYASRGV